MPTRCGARTTRSHLEDAGVAWAVAFVPQRDPHAPLRDGRCLRRSRISKTSPDFREHARIYRAEGIRSLLIVPLNLQNSIPDGSQRRHDHVLLAYAARRSPNWTLRSRRRWPTCRPAALNLSELNEQNQREKTRLAFLAEASAVLASSLDYESTLQRVAQLAVPQIADWCTVHMMENGVPNADRHRPRRSGDAGGRHGSIVAVSQRRSARTRAWSGRCARRRTEVVPAVTDEMVVALISDPEQLRDGARVEADVRASWCR